MSNIMSKVVIFAAGSAVGSVATWALIKNKYEQLVKEEVQSVKDYYSRMHEKDTPDDAEDPQDEEPAEETERSPEEETEEAREAYFQAIEELGYAHYNDDIFEKGDPEADEGPRVITPDEFGERDDYEIRSLMYYADHVLTDDDDNIINDVDSLVGSDSLTHFGEYEEDSVFVRNDELETDFEILLEPRHYSDLYPQGKE